MWDVLTTVSEDIAKEYRRDKEREAAKVRRNRKHRQQKQTD